MSTGKRKISVRKVLQTLVTIIVVTGFTMAIISADRKQNSRNVSSVRIRVKNSDRVHFLDEQGVEKMLFTDKHMNPEAISLASLDIHNMENIIKSNAWVNDAQVYVDNERHLYIDVTQKVPQVRIFEQSGHSYYIDGSLRSIPLSDDYVHYAPVVTNVPALENDSTSNAIKANILWLMDHVVKDKFWNAQIAQVVYVGKNNYELIPVLGKQRILLGDTSRLDDKLENLMAFYKQVENKVGWEKYETIDLRYKDQVIASPAISWAIPKDAAMLNMNWVTAIMESVPKDEKDEAVDNALDTGIVAARVSTDDVPVPVEARTSRSRQDVVRSALPIVAAPAVSKNVIAVAPKPVLAKPVVKKPALSKPTIVKERNSADNTKPKSTVTAKKVTAKTAASTKTPVKANVRTTAASSKKTDKKPPQKPVKKAIVKPASPKKTATTPKKPATNH